MIRKKKKRILIVSALLLLAAICIAWAIAYTKQGPYKHLDHDRYITVCMPGVPQIESAAVTDEEVAEEIDRQLSSENSVPLARGTVSEGDAAVISYSGTIHGKPFEGSDASERLLVVGSGAIPEFEQAVRGEKTGMKVMAEIEYPPDYADAQIAGQTAVYEIYIEGIQKESSETYTDAFAKKQGFAGRKEYEQSVRREILAEKQKEREKNAEEFYWARILSCARMLDFPDGLVREEAHNTLDMHKAYASAHGMSWNAFLSDYLKTDEKTLNRMLISQARQTVKEKLLTYKLAKEKNIWLSNREYRKWKEDLFEETNKTEESIAADYGVPFSEYEKKMDLRSKALRDEVKTEVYRTRREER